MAHDLNFRDGRASMFSVQEIPWHGLGVVVPEKLTSKEAIIEAQLDYTVKSGKVFVEYDDVTRQHTSLRGVPVDNTFVTYRGDTGEPLCSDGKAVTKNYQIIQNVDAFDFFDSIVGEGKAVFETAGAIKKGETVFITAKLPDSAFVTKEDKIDQYLLMSLNHNGTASVVVMFTPIRVVCNNTLHAALAHGTNAIKIRHSASYKEKLEIAKSILGLASSNIDTLLDKAKYFADYKLSNHAMQKLISSTFLTSDELKVVAEVNYDYNDRKLIKDFSTKKLNVLNAVGDYMHRGPGQTMDGSKNTLWGFVNGVTGYFQNSKVYIKGGKVNQEHKFTNMFGGTAERLSRRAFALAEQEVFGV